MTAIPTRGAQIARTSTLPCQGGGTACGGRVVNGSRLRRMNCADGRNYPSVTFGDSRPRPPVVKTRQRNGNGQSSRRAAPATLLYTRRARIRQRIRRGDGTRGKRAICLCNEAQRNGYHPPVMQHNSGSGTDNPPVSLRNPPIPQYSRRASLFTPFGSLLRSQRTSRFASLV